MLISSIVGEVVPENVVSPTNREDAGGLSRGAGSDVREAGRSLPHPPDMKLVVKPDKAL